MIDQDPAAFINDFGYGTTENALDIVQQGTVRTHDIQQYRKNLQRPLNLRRAAPRFRVASRCFPHAQGVWSKHLSTFVCTAKCYIGFFDGCA